jgi:hypothetical protein
MAALVTLADARAVAAWRASGDVVNPLPEETAPAILVLIEGDLRSGLYRARGLVGMSAVEQHSRMAVQVLSPHGAGRDVHTCYLAADRESALRFGEPKRSVRAATGVIDSMTRRRVRSGALASTDERDAT